MINFGAYRVFKTLVSPFLQIMNPTHHFFPALMTAIKGLGALKGLGTAKGLSALGKGAGLFGKPGGFLSGKWGGLLGQAAESGLIGQGQQGGQAGAPMEAGFQDRSVGFGKLGGNNAPMNPLPPGGQFGQGNFDLGGLLEMLNRTRGPSRGGPYGF